MTATDTIASDEAHRPAQQCHPSDLAEHHGPDARRVGAQRHAHAEFVGALRDRVGEHAVEADRSQERREQGKGDRVVIIQSRNSFSRTSCGSVVIPE